MSGDPLWAGLKGNIAGIAWPPVLRGQAAALETLLRQFERTQWLDPSGVETNQLRQLRGLAAHAEKQSPHFAQRMKRAGLGSDDLVAMDALRALPLLTRRDLQSSAADIYCRDVPPDHLPLHENRTSGSTGEPVAVKRTPVTRLFWLANTMREYFWHERDFSWRFTAIRPQIPKHTIRADWGQPANLLFDTGEAQFIPIVTDIAQAVDWTRQFDPHVLLVYPNVLDGMLAHCRKQGIGFDNLKLIRSISETLSPHLRAAAADYFGVRIVENYSSQEIGIIAVGCPEGRGLHAMAESVIVEVLDDLGRPCREGQTGQVVVTDLTNFATPMIRYAIGDYAEAGGHCACGRGLPLLNRIVGRERNLVRRPDGTRHYPLVGFAQFRDLAPVVQYQIVQHDLQRLEVRLVTERVLTPGEEDSLRRVIIEALGYPFDLSFAYFADRLARGANGKFDEFICLVRDGDTGA